MQPVKTEQPKGPLVWLDMDQKALDDAYDQTVYAPNREMTYEKAIFNSQRVRDRLGNPKRFAYGPTEIEAVDVFTAKQANAPVHIYVHGGAWRQRKASEYAYIAELFVRAGAHCVIPDFVGVEHCSGNLLTIADQALRSIAWVCKNAENFGGDPNRIYISGRSSGAHLGGVAVTTDWTGHGLPLDVIKGALLCSGMYDLKPVRLSKRSRFVTITAESEEKLSAQRHLDRLVARARSRHPRDTRVQAADAGLSYRSSDLEQAGEVTARGRLQPLRPSGEGLKTVQRSRQCGAGTDGPLVLTASLKKTSNWEEHMLSRRHFITAAAAALATHSLPARAQPRRRIIVDGQVHLWKAESDDWKWVPGRPPQLPDPFTIERLIPMMDEAGVDRVVVVPPSWPGDRNDYAFEAVNRYPTRFAVMGRIPLEKPESAALLPKWREQPWMKGVRLTFQREQYALLRDGHAEWFWTAAEKLNMPVMFFAPRNVSKFAEVAERHPGLPMIIDHMSLHHSMAETGEIAKVIDDVIALAKYPNVSVKMSSVPNYSREPYPFKDMDLPLKRCFDAFGPRRCHWGTDITNSFPRATYKERVEHFTKEITFMSEDDKDWVMGRSLLDKLKWV